MKIPWFLLGLGIGIVATAVGLYVYPFEHGSRTERVLSAFADERSESVFLDVPGHEVVLSHGGMVPLAPFPEGTPALSEPALRGGLALLSKLRDRDGTVVGFATELERASPESNLLAGKIMTDTWWSVVLPGRGTLFLYQTENNWALMRRIALPALLLGREWRGEWQSVNTLGPLPDGRGRIVGGTGEFEGASGSFIEVGQLRRFTPEGAMEFTMELRLAIDEEES